MCFYACSLFGFGKFAGEIGGIVHGKVQKNVSRGHVGSFQETLVPDVGNVDCVAPISTEALNYK
jgi:hypothetical protein